MTELGRGLPPLPIDPEHEAMAGHEYQPYLLEAVAVVGPEGIEAIMGTVGCKGCDQAEAQAVRDAMERLLGMNVTSRRQPMGMDEQAQEIRDLPTVER